MSSSSNSTGSDGSEHKSEPKESLAEIRARALRESAERRKQKADELAAPPAAAQPLPTAASVPVPSQQAVAQQQQQPAPQQQQQMTLQQAHDIGLAKGQQSSYITGFIAAVIVCGGVFIAYKGVTWAMSSAKTVAAPARVARSTVAAVAQ